MKNKLLILLFSCIQLIFLKPWIQCKSFLYDYHFSFYDLELQLIDAVNKDRNLPIFIARFFHNKASQFVIDIYKRYTHFLDLRLLITLLSFVGFFGVLLGIWYFIESKKRNWKIGLLIFLTFLAPFVEVLINPKLPFILKLIIIATPFNVLSIYGHVQFISKHKSLLVLPIYILLIVLSIAWITVIPDQAFNYCTKR